MNLGPTSLLLAIFFVWALILTVIFLKFYLYFQRISKGSKKDSILSILSDVLDKEKGLREDVDAIGNDLKQLSFDSKFYIQKVGLARFNPFNDTGGDQSFILALLDENNTGVVVSSLHTRGGTRWYAKKVVGGKSVEYELSADEIKTIKSATSTKKHKE